MLFLYKIQTFFKKKQRDKTRREDLEKKKHKCIYRYNQLIHKSLIIPLCLIRGLLKLATCINLDLYILYELK